MPAKRYFQPLPAAVGHAGVGTSRRLQEAMRDHSNLEMDWLWLATQVACDCERCYCLQQALCINPRSAFAQRGLAQLQRSQPRGLVVQRKECCYDG